MGYFSIDGLSKLPPHLNENECCTNNAIQVANNEIHDVKILTRSCSIAITSWQTQLTMFPGSPMLTLITLSNALGAGTVVITAAVLVTSLPCPANIAQTLVVRGSGTFTMDTLMVTSVIKDKCG